MTREEILNGILQLASSKGSYGRLYQALQDPDAQDAFFESYPPENYKSFIKFIMDIEG